MVHAGDRPAAIDRLRRALDETEIAGIQTTLPFHRFVARHAGFRAGDLSTDWVGERWDGPGERARYVLAAAAAAGARAPWRTGSRRCRGRPPPSPTRSRTSSAPESPWAIAARTDATDRWPR